MPSVKNISGENRIVPSLGGRLVLAGQEVEVPEGDVEAFTCQAATWALADKPNKRTNDKAEVQS